jgi:hypothetical protein
MSRNVWLIAVFSGFVVLIFGYAWVYQRMYVANHSRFLFNAEIAAQQERQVQTDLQDHIALLARQQRLLEDAQRELYTGRIPRVERWTVDKAIFMSFIQTPSARFQFSLEFEFSPRDPEEQPHPGRPFPALTVVDAASGTQLGRWVSGDSRLLTGTIADYQALTSGFLRDVTRELESARRQQSGFSGGAQIWSYWDFVYFSAITAGTVGYGDILPNSTAIRMLVVSELLCSSFLLIVLLNVVFKAGRER